MLDSKSSPPTPSTPSGTSFLEVQLDPRTFSGIKGHDILDTLFSTKIGKLNPHIRNELDTRYQSRFTNFLPSKLSAQRKLFQLFCSIFSIQVNPSPSLNTIKAMLEQGRGFNLSNLEQIINEAIKPTAHPTILSLRHPVFLLTIINVCSSYYDWQNHSLSAGKLQQLNEQMSEYYLSVKAKQLSKSKNQNSLSMSPSFFKKRKAIEEAKPPILSPASRPKREIPAAIPITTDPCFEDKPTLEQTRQSLLKQAEELISHLSPAEIELRAQQFRLPTPDFYMPLPEFSPTSPLFHGSFFHPPHPEATMCKPEDPEQAQSNTSTPTFLEYKNKGWG